MKKNIGTADRIIRLVAAVAIGLLLVTGSLSGIPGMGLGIFAVIFLVTSTVSFCPLYVPFKISTKRGASPPVH